MSFVLCRLKELRDLGFSIILLHHTPKSNDKTYKGSTAILDLADHVLSLQKVKKNNPNNIVEDNEEEDCYYRFGTKDKTRYEPYHIFLDFDPEKGFVIAPDPDEEVLKNIHALIDSMKNSTGEMPIQSKIINRGKDELSLSDKNSKIQNSHKCIDNTEFASLSEDIKQTDKQALKVNMDQKPIDLTDVKILGMS